MITPSDEQARAIAAISNWYRSERSRRPFFYLGGYAGSGKTTIARLAVESCGLDPDNHRDVLYGSFTGKAAMVMQQKGLKQASTVHQMIYRLVQQQRRKGQPPEPVFELNKDSDVKFAKLVVLDECSMINDSMARDLLSFGTKILVLGDPGQLDPISGHGFFTKNAPDYFLKEIHRQALESPIIYWATQVRKGYGIPFGDSGEFRKVSLDEISPEELMSSDQIITGQHVTRKAFNQNMLGYEGYEDMVYPTLPGVKLINIRNDRMRGLLNGMIGRTTKILDPDEDFNQPYRYLNQTVFVDNNQGELLEFHDIPMRMDYFEDNYDLRSDQQRETDEEIYNELWMHHKIKLTHWDFGYAITVHKAQGSQWDDVILFDDHIYARKKTVRAKWLYTAITRAAERVTVAV